MIVLRLQVIPLIKGKLSGKGQERSTQACQLIKKAELNAKRRESYLRKKAEREAIQNNIENLGIIVFKPNRSVCACAENKERCSKRYYNMTDDQKAERNAKRRAKRTVNLFDVETSIASDEGYHISCSIIIFISTYKVYFLN